MTMVSIGDLARTLMLQRHTGTSKQALQRLAGELASGRHADLSRQVRGDLAPLAGIEGALARIDGWRSAAGDLGLRLGAMQTALGALDGVAGATAEQLLAAAVSAQPAQVDRAARDAGEALDAMIGVLNARVGDKAVFAGVEGDNPALAGADVMLDALVPLMAGATGVDAVETALQAWFDDPAGFAAVVYQGGAAQTGVGVGPGELVAPGVIATDPALRNALAGFALAALADRGVLAGSDAGRRGLIQRSAERLMGNAGERALLAARLGSVEARLDRAQARNGTEAGALEIARSGLISADPYKTAAELELTRVQIETLYGLTARLSGLSLAGYLR